ncbi:MAG: [protein-PII] uridylyltransferase [Gallionella sp.]
MAHRLPLHSSETSDLRTQLRNDRSDVEQRFLQHGKAARTLGQLSRLTDSYLRHVWQRLQMPKQIALVAVGGYGRGELYPNSDIDLLILLDVDPNDLLQLKLQELIRELWDIGMDVGHSVRTLEQCLVESSDITVLTNLLEARRITGNARLFGELRIALDTQLDPCLFYTAKLHEQQRRHARFMESDFNLEPNLKESPGGLRDLQTISWICHAAGLGTDWSDRAVAGLISETEARKLKRHHTLLQTLRIRLHYLSGRREDRLVFDFQAQLAEQMGIPVSTNRRASEQLMQRYYQTKLAVRQFNTILLQHLHDYLFKAVPKEHALNERYVSKGTLLEIRDERLFELVPESIFELFLLLQQHTELTDVSAKTLRALWRARKQIDSSFRRNPVNRQNFMKIMRQPQGIVHALRRMNQYGILGRYIPSFGRIVGQMQYDLFHVYTVDEHTMMVVRNLRRFAVPSFAHEFPLCSRLIGEFDRPEVLYLAGLFHDIAKGRGGDHSQLGKRDARHFCVQHALSKEDTDLLVWLVEHHLSLSATAQKQDLSDPEVIASFAAQIKNQRYLVALYLLTVADVRGTSPKVWNAWKAKLIEDLFKQTGRFISDGVVENKLGAVREEAASILNLYAIPTDTYELFWSRLDESYFMDHEPHEIAWHCRLLAFNINPASVVVKTRLSRTGEGLQVLVYCPDQKSLFSRICDFFARMSFTIVEAKIHSTRHGYALNSFQVMAAKRTDTVYRDLMTYIEFELTQQITQQKVTLHDVSGRVSRQMKMFPISTTVEISRDRKGLYILTMVAGDRPGLLARIARVLDQQEIKLHRAKINTLGSRAEDVFWISGAALTQAKPLESLCDDLRDI